MLEFFVDRSLERHEVVNALRAGGASVHAHDDSFPDTTLDAEWIVNVSARGWVILTKDKYLRHRALELQAIEIARARVFALGSGNRRGVEMAQIFVHHLDAMTAFARANDGPFVVSVTRTSLTQLFPITVREKIARSRRRSVEDRGDASAR